jgi:tetratricopeptide (TPR) repeat protein
MKHVVEIRKIVDEGKADEAFLALEDLLALGPQNIEALKLQAVLFAHKGRFDQEEKIWQKILTIDDEDSDAISYFQSRQQEEQFLLFFTDELADGGRRYVAYPRRIVPAAFYGLFGCLSFLLLAKFSETYSILGNEIFLISSFLLLVFAPFLTIITLWLKSLKDVSISRNGIVFRSRFKHIEYRWSEIDDLQLVYGDSIDSPTLNLIVVPKEQTLPCIDLDLGSGSTSIKARSYFMKEINRFFAIGLPKNRTETKFRSQDFIHF